MNKYRPFIAASVFLALFLMASIWLILQYVQSERERDLFNWQDRLSILAESQKRSIEDWLESQIKNLDELAENPLTQIFLSMEAMAEERSEVERGQVAHLRNLLTATAKRSGLFSESETIRSNPAESSNDGIALLDEESRLLISTRNFPRIDQHVIDAVQQAKRNERAIIYGIYSNDDREPRLIIAVPVTRVQAADNASDFPGFVVAVINPHLSLYQQFSQHWLTTTSDEAYLVGGDDNSTVYLSPLEGDYHLFHRAALSSDQLASNFSRLKTGGFDLKKDYRGVDVLVTGRSIDGTGWILVQKIDASEALRESKAYQDFVHTVFLLAVFVITIGFVAIWRHSTSVRLQKTTERLAARTALLNSVGDNIRDHIFLLDADDNVVFINKALSDSLGIHYEEIVGRSLHHIFSIETTGRLLELKKDSEAREVKNKIMRLSIADDEHDFHVSLVPLTQGEFKDSLLFVLHDITEIKETQDRHNRLLEGIIATLVHATDMHDPHCAHHSERTREVAVAIAGAMDIPEDKINILSMAALLANIGKLYLPRELLTKHAPLTEEEEQVMRQHVEHASDILKGLEFDGPVIEIIQQKNERLDGNGYPKGLLADDIMREARIIAVANAFVAMSSARAYRPGLPINEVIDKLLEQADEAYDRNVIAALFHIAENRSDWRNWQQVQES
jgi:PAS domain S-box-containing protein